MNNDNFQKLFTKEHGEAMMAKFSKAEFPKLKQSTKEEKLEATPSDGKETF